MDNLVLCVNSLVVGWDNLPISKDNLVLCVNNLAIGKDSLLRSSDNLSISMDNLGGSGDNLIVGFGWDGEWVLEMRGFGLVFRDCYQNLCNFGAWIKIKRVHKKN